MKIGVLSDTHGYLHPTTFDFFKNCDEIWHAGDIGNVEVLDQLKLIAPVRAVFGNCDDWEIRGETKEILTFECEGQRVAMMHISGYPGKFMPAALQIIKSYKPTLLVGGHSHILKVINDPHNNLLFINPGAAGRYGIHSRLTFLRFEVHKNTFSNMEIFDEPKQQPVLHH